jgi:hypothetical protein
MSTEESTTFEGTCGCGSVRFQMTQKPLFVHCCHCRWCQRETGSAFAVNALIEAEHVRLLTGSIETVLTPSESGKGQKIIRCPTCHVALWSNYSGAGDLVRFVRVGTLLDSDRFPPDIHIYTSSKQPWVVLPEDIPVVGEYYDHKYYWSQENLGRARKLEARMRNE